MAEVSGGTIAGIEEKPKHPKSNYAVTGIYMYDATVFDKIKTLVPSHRGELEITDVNNAYIGEGTMTFSFLDGWWTDAGTFDSLLRATNLVAQSVLTANRLPERRCEGARASDAAETAAQPSARFLAASDGLRTARARLPQGHRRPDRLAGFARPDRGRARAALLGLPGRPRLFSGSPAHGPGPGGRLSAPRPRQISAALSFPGTIKAFHFHLHQTDCWTPAKGMFQVVLVDLRLGSRTFGQRNTLYVGAAAAVAGADSARRGRTDIRSSAAKRPCWST